MHLALDSIAAKRKPYGSAPKQTVMKVREESIKFGAHKKKKIAEKQEESILEKNLAKVFTDDAVKQKMWSELETKKRENN